MKYQSANQRRLVQLDYAKATNEAKKLQHLTDKLCLLKPDMVGVAEKFWSLRTELMHLSTVLDSNLRECFVLRIGDINPFRKIIK